MKNCVTFEMITSNLPFIHMLVVHTKYCHATSNNYDHYKLLIFLYICTAALLPARHHHPHTIGRSTNRLPVFCVRKSENSATNSTSSPRTEDAHNGTFAKVQVVAGVDQTRFKYLKLSFCAKWRPILCIYASFSDLERVCTGVHMEFELT